MTGGIKPKTVDIADSNIAGLGTDLEKQVRLHAAQTEKAWKDVGQEPGLRVWRIEKFCVVEVPKDSIGTFYDGDSYIILNTYKKPDEPKLFHDVHFWLGTDTTQDEAGTAAYKTVELDDYLGGAPIQHREVQGFESKLFLSYFPKLVINKGGVDSGFNKVGPKEYKPRLYHISGNVAKTLSVKQVDLTYKSLNDGDVFVLDNGLKIFQMNMTKSTPQERRKAAEFAHSISADRGGSKVIVYDQDDEALDFWEAIGGKGPIAPAESVKEPVPTVKKLFKVSDATGTLETTQIATGKDIKRTMLDADDVFILDGSATVFVWVGKGATPQEKKSGLQIALKYVVDAGLPPTTPITRILQGGESSEFLANFF